MMYKPYDTGQEKNHWRKQQVIYFLSFNGTFSLPLKQDTHISILHQAPPPHYITGPAST